MIDPKALHGQVKRLVVDLRGQLTRDADLRSALRQEWVEARKAERVGGTFETWLDGVLDQAAVAWVLACVFVRFCEDHGYVDRVWIGGPEPEAPVELATQARQRHLIANPLHNDRHWLREAFGHLRGLRATQRIFNGHNPVWRFDISGQAAEDLSEFFRRGEGFHSLRTDNGTDSTRFLGDLYEKLSDHARSTYALLQTPVFVEEFILNRTLDPAVQEFGLVNTSVIDPTCGSGHFLLGAFHRLLNMWKHREPATSMDILVERVLAQITGVDINPFAVAIARFRLVVAALRVTGRTNLNNDYPVRVGAGDSLLDWGARSTHQGDLLAELEGGPAFAFYTEDGDLLTDYLRPNQYTVVVGNPPYITVKDATLNARYREAYPEVCYRQYAMTVPFAQRFFQLAKRGDDDGDFAGYVGQITANSFMKREFGKKLINEYFAAAVELNEVIDTSGAYIPGHGTPTVILVGRNRLVSPRYSGSIRTVLGIRGEPSTPDDPAHGLVWTSIAQHIDLPGAESETEWITVTDTPRDQFSVHPWSLSGGGASEVVESIGRATSGEMAHSVDLPVGRAVRAGADEAYVRPLNRVFRTAADQRALRPLVIGEVVRDWIASPTDAIWYPYDSSFDSSGLSEELWPWKGFLAARRTFQGNMHDAGLDWWAYMQHTASAYRTPLSIAFAFVATHNHFVLDRGGKVFNRTAPVIKLPQEATEDDHLRLLGLLNSSTACFWLKQVSQNRGSTVDSRGARQTTVPWEDFYEFTSTNLERFPLPGGFPLGRGRELDRLGQRLAEVTPAAVAETGVPTQERLAQAHTTYHSIRARMIAWQEELDWEVYRLYGLLRDDLTTPDPPELQLGERAFEIVLARRIRDEHVQTQWFARHYSKPITDLPEGWSDDYKQLVERRIEIIEHDRRIGLIERPECKRRWQSEGWKAMRGRAQRDWLLDRLESAELWGGPASAPTPLSVAQIADRMRHDDDFRGVLDLWAGSDQHDLTTTIGRLVADEQVPYLPAHRYKASGLRKRAQWERTWALQRREDNGETVDIDVPPKYASADFVKPSYWRNRGKLDVPKERFIGYPRIGRDGDASELLGWAGWDHLAQARALAGVYLDRKTQAGWQSERLLWVLAGLAEIEPWLKQWHDEPEPGFPGSPAEFFSGLIDTELAYLSADRSILAKLRGVEELS